MAKWGEGDPRWIVEERPDATNVNNWHWTEKNATAWSKERLKELLGSVEIDGAAGRAKITDVSLEGEASASHRKGKLIFFYEWDIKMNWKGTINSDAMESVSGTITIPNLSDENDADQIDLTVTVKEKGDGAGHVKEMIRTKGLEIFRNQAGSYINQLKQEFSQGMILPTDNKMTKSNSASKLASEFQQTTINTSTPTTNSSVGMKISTKTLKMKEDFMCSVEELYRSLTEKEMIQAFTRDQVIWELETGGKFSLLSGLITGEFQDIVPHEKIVQRWRFKSWPESHHSMVTMKFTQGPSCATLTLVQTGVPESEVERTKQGWTNYYWESIRRTFGYLVNVF